MDQKVNHGIFTISLDFELHWGVSDHRTVKSYKENLDNTPQVVDKLLKVFLERKIHVTWATVGMLFCDNKESLTNNFPNNLPSYTNPRLSNYDIVDDIGHNIDDDPYHYALPLISKIRATPHQEIGTHTFSHYYTLEAGQTLDQFREDMNAAFTIAQREDINMKSIVFPRNQYADEHIEVIEELGTTAYRGNESHWIYLPRSRAHETWTRKLFRLIDAYIKISGDNTYNIDFKEKCINIRSSRFLRPYSPTFRLLDPLRLYRIKKEMTYAAQNNRLFHLWWHPHNFGAYTTKNLDFLNRILDHYDRLNSTYGFQSLNMQEVSKLKKDGL
ncbi:MAG: hypothetical protein V3V00_04125 [Saprospiraceae bacterium]